MKVLVSGGAGFIGSHTVDALLAEGYEVRIMDVSIWGQGARCIRHLHIEDVGLGTYQFCRKKCG